VALKVDVNELLHGVREEKLGQRRLVFVAFAKASES
jgi:hypothetical protein